MKFERIEQINGAPAVLRFLCPGCKTDFVWDQLHTVNESWGFNGDVDRPTLTSSVMVQGVRPNAEGKPAPWICHANITDGKLHFHQDCSHALVGQVIELPEWVRPRSTDP